LTKILAAITAVFLSSIPLAAQNAATPKCTDCVAIQATATVSGDVSVDAGLMPPKVALRIFGKDIGNSYGVFLLTISNHSPDATLIVQSVFIDYSRWTLAGCQSFGPLPGPVLASYQVASRPCQSASAEQGTLRALLTHGQAFSWRNQLIRYLTAGGAIASALVWRAGPAANFPKYVSTITGTVIPSLGLAVPDEYIDRLNLLNDSGFRVNTVVPKQASAVVVAFFPFDKFLTPTLKRYFLANPALFFSPNLLLTEDASRQDLMTVLQRVLTNAEYKALALSGDGTQKTLRVDWAGLPDAARISCSQTSPAAGSEAAKLADAVKAAKSAADQAQDLLKSIQGSDATTAANLNKLQQQIAILTTTFNDLSDAAARAVTAAATQSARLSADYATQAKAAADAATATLKQIGDKLNAAPPATPADSAKFAADLAAMFQQIQLQVASVAGATGKPGGLSVQARCDLQHVLDGLSLNTIRAVVGGEMSVDVDSIPATIQNVTFDNSDAVANFATSGDKTGVIKGLYLSGGKVQISNLSELGIKDANQPATITDGSSDTALKFKLTLTGPIPSGKTIHFTVVKTKKDGTTIASGESLYPVSYVVKPPAIDNVTAVTDSGTTTVTVTGANLYDFDLKYKLTSESTGKTRTYPASGQTAVAIGKLTPKSFELVFKSTDLEPGRWLIHLTSTQFPADYPAPKDKPFQIPVNPVLTSAKADSTGKVITVTGTGFYDLSKEDDMKLTFKILKKDKTNVDAPATIKDTTTVELNLAVAAVPGDDQVEVFVGKADKAAGQTAIGK
jgi:hypothetical protein